MAPTLVVTPYEVDSTAANTTSLVTPSFTPSNGEVIVIKVVSADIGFPTHGAASGGSQTYISRVHDTTASHCEVSIITAVISGSPGLMTITVPFSGSAGWHSMVVERWGSAQLAGSPATTDTRGTAAASATCTTAANNSVVSWCLGDWNAVSPATRAYRSSATEDGLHNKSTSFYVAYYAYQTAATAGAQTCGLTAPTGQQWTLAGIEVQAGATNYTQTVTDDTGSSDTATQTVAAAQSLTDSTGSTDTATLSASASRTVTDSSGSTDAAAQASAFTKSVADNGGLTDSVAQLSSITQSVTDDTGLLDSTAQLSVTVRTVTDLTGSTDGVTQSGGLVEYTLYPDSQFTSLVDSTDTNAQVVATCFYTFGGDGSLEIVAINLYAPVMTATAFEVQILTDADHDGFPDTVVASAPVSAGQPSATKIRIDLTAPVPMVADAGVTKYWAAVVADHSLSRSYQYGFVSGAFSSSVLFNGLTDTYGASNSDVAVGNGSYSYTGVLPTNNFGSTWYGVEPVVAAASGTDYTQTFTDGAGSTDSVTQLLTAAQQFTEATGSTDTASQLSAATRAFTDATGSTDSVAQQATNSFAQTFTDGTGSTDQVTQLAASVRSFTDPTGSTDSLTSGATVPRTINDDTGSTDLGQSYQADYAETLADPTGSTDNVSQQSSSAGGQTFTDNAGSTDSVIQVSVTNYTYTITDSTGSADSTATALARSFTDPTGTSDTASQVSNQTRTVTDDAGSTDTVSQQQSSAGGQTFTDSTGSTDTTGQATAYVRVFTDGTGSTDAVSQQSSTAGGQTFIDPTGNTDNLTQLTTYTVTITDSTGTTDSAVQAGSNHYAYTFTDNTGSTDQMIQAGKPFPDMDLVCTVEPSRLTVSVESGRLIVSTEPN